MKRFIRSMTLVVFVVILFVLLSGCNKQMIDLNYNFNYAYIDIPGHDVVEGKVDSWKDFEDGDQIQVTIDGVTYLTDTTRCVLVHK